MANFDFDELKQRAINTAENIADMSAELYKKAEAKTKSLAKKAKLNADIAKDKNSLRRVYAELGKLYFEKYGEHPDDDFIQCCLEARNLNDMIKSNQAELDAMKETAEEDDADIEVEILIDDGDEAPDAADDDTEAEISEENDAE